jgi:metallo-beta-lactamase family protein
MTTTLTFLGAAGTVTGSKYLLTVDERRILIDAGLFQGEKQWRRRNWEDFPVPPDTITDVLLTHAHADHCAYLPALVKRGFDGPVWCTRGTRDLAEIVLRDSAYLAERDAKEAAAGGWSKHNPPLPIYTGTDVDDTLPLMTTVEYDAQLDLGDGITAVFTRAGHILGAASITITTPDTSILFSGDLGRADHPVLRAQEQPPGAAYVVVESTYGDRDHPKPPNLPHEAMADAIRRTVARGGSVLIPAFAVDRVEIVLRALSQMRRHDRIPDVPIFVNSPMAVAALEVYKRAGTELRPDISSDAFARMDNLHMVRSAEGSQVLTEKRRTPHIVLTSSGMASGGRVIHHLKSMLPDARNTVIMTGYQGVGTRGRSLVEGADQVKIFGEWVPVNAEIVQDGEFSVHADATDLDTWLARLDPRPQTVFVTHGEARSAQAMATRVRQQLGVTAVVPSYGDEVTLSGQPVEVQAAIEATGVAGSRVTSDLRVREQNARRIVLEGTITIDLE